MIRLKNPTNRMGIEFTEKGVQSSNDGGIVGKNPAPDKATQQLVWAAHMNTLKVQAEEMAVSELIYWIQWLTTKAVTDLANIIKLGWHKIK